MLTRHHWAKNLHDAGYQPRRMKFPQDLNGYMFKTKRSHLDGGHRLWSGIERELRHATLPKTHHMKMAITTPSIPARSSPGARTALSVAGHQDGGEKYATDGPKSLRARNNMIIVVVVGILPSRETMVCALCDCGLISLVESSDGCDSAARSLHGSLYRSCRTRSLTVGLVLGSAASLSSLLSSP